MKRYLALVGVLLLVGCALADAVWPKQPELLITAAAAKPAAAPVMPQVMICSPLLIGDQAPKPISRT